MLDNGRLEIWQWVKRSILISIMCKNLWYILINNDNFSKYHERSHGRVYMVGIHTTILRNKTLVFAHWAAGEIHTSLLIPATVWRFPPCIQVVTCWAPTPICRYWGCESEQLSGCASLTGCAVLWFGRPYTTGPPRVVYKQAPKKIPTEEKNNNWYTSL